MKKKNINGYLRELLPENVHALVTLSADYINNGLVVSVQLFRNYENSLHITTVPGTVDETRVPRKVLRKLVKKALRKP